MQLAIDATMPLPSRMSTARALLAALASLCLFALGCTHVAPYERGALAHSTMTASGFDGPATRHVTAVHEGATGGGSVAESGCGCN
jgi:hypothetical protein